MNMLILFDLDTFVYQAGYGSEKTKYTIMTQAGEAIAVPIGTSKKQVNELLKEYPNSTVSSEIIPLSLEYAKANIDALIGGVMDELSSIDEYTIFKGFLTAKDDKTNFRYAVAKTKPYKGQRKASSRPIFYDDLRAHLRENYDVQVVSGMEADDMLSIMQRQSKQSSIIVGIDKDLLQIPGWHYNFRTKETTYVTPLKGAFNLWKQVLMGDNADNIPGLNGIGPKTAEKLLKDCTNEEEMRIIVTKEYEKQNKKELLDEVYKLCKLLEVYHG